MLGALPSQLDGPNNAQTNYIINEHPNRAHTDTSTKNAHPPNVLKRIHHTTSWGPSRADHRLEINLDPLSRYDDPNPRVVRLKAAH